MKQQNSTVIRIIWGTALVIWMGVIFYFSSQTGEESSEMSGGIIQMVARFIWRDYENLSILEQTARLDSLTFVVRKGAHFTEYGILGFLASGFLSTWKLKCKHFCGIRVGIAWCFSILYAVSDELHQSFSDGRSPKAFDVLVDSCGALAGIGVFFLIAWLLKKYLYKKSSHELREEKKAQ